MEAIARADIVDSFFCSSAYAKPVNQNNQRFIFRKFMKY